MSYSFLKLVNNPFKFKFFLFAKLPSAFFSGVSVSFANENKCVVTIPYKWFSKNPFKSTYFACLSMAAEMSTGILALAFIKNKKPAVSMLVVKMESTFFKKAIGKTSFVCNEGLLIKEIIDAAIASGESKTITAKSTGTNTEGEVVAEFLITWSFKVKTQMGK